MFDLHTANWHDQKKHTYHHAM